MKKVKVVASGARAIEMAQGGAALHVRSFSGYEPAGPGAVNRALRMDPHARWIYVVLG